MRVEIVMPKLSDTMEEGTILKWLKAVGDTVAAGEPIAEVETDKADMEVEASQGGVLREIKVGEGESAAVGTVIALLEERASTVAAGPPVGSPEALAGARAASGGLAAGSAPGPKREEAPPRASPAARKIAEELGIDLRAVKGSGPGGRIVREDVEAAAASTAPATAEGPAAAIAAPARPEVSAPDIGPVPPAAEEPASGIVPAAATPAAARGEDRSRAGAAGAPAAAERVRPVAVSERQELSRMRQSIARRMSESFRDIPHFYVTAEIDMEEAVRLREALQQSELYATPISYTHLVLKATALALRHHPRLNASFGDGAIEVKGEINIGMAVALDEGLIVPVLRRVDELSLEEIAIQARRLVEQAKQGRFASEDLSGGTFTVSNMGMLDIEDFTAVINPPQAAILAVGSIKERPVVRNGAVVPAHTVRVTLSCDHRIIDGVVGGRFLEELKRLLENPIVLVVHDR